MPTKTPKTKTPRKKVVVAGGLKAPIYDQAGKESGEIALPEALFGLPWNSDLVHQVAVSLRSNQRVGTADTKGRNEVSGGGKKPWKQKGTGRARHGSSRSPIWRGGGVTHGPKAEKDYAKKINRQAKVRALGVVLSRKLRDGEMLFVSDLALTKPQTKVAQGILQQLGKVAGFERLNYKRGNRALVALPAKNENAWKSLRNLPTVRVLEARELNALDLLNHQYVLFVDPAASVAVLEGRFTAAKAKK
jgi:large subunit ribosomal protein L4